MTTVFAQSHFDRGMQIIAQMQVKVFFLFFSSDKHYLILHIFFLFLCVIQSFVYGVPGGVTCLSIHHLYLTVLMFIKMKMMILLEVNLNDQL